MAATKSPTILRRWAALSGSPKGSALAVSRQSEASWHPAASLIAAAERDAEVSQDELKRLAGRSSARMFPDLGDPLDPTLDFGTHRWLSSSREESYSDWLAWILSRQGVSGPVLRLFGLKPGPLARSTCWADREVDTAQGRLDLVIRCGGCGNRGTFAIEIKTASEAGDDQLSRYLTWLKTQPAPRGLALLAINQPENLSSDSWVFRSWEEVSAGLRTWAWKWLRDGRGIHAAMTSAFCGAVEQNLVGLCPSGLNAPRTVRYLEEWLERNCDAKKRF